MKKTSWLVGLGLSFLVSACGLNPTGVDQPTSLKKEKQSLTVQLDPDYSSPYSGVGGIDKGKDYKLDVAQFRSKMNLAIRNVKGYQYVLIKNRVVVDEKAGGYAKREWVNQQNIYDGVIRQMMTTSTYSNVGSVSKFPVAVAMVVAMHRKGHSINFLDNKIWHYLPTPWKSVMHDNIKWITFRDLMAHTSGFSETGTPSDVVEALKAGVSRFSTTGDGIKIHCSNVLSKPDDQTHTGYCHGVYGYANVNYRLLGYLIASYYDTQLRLSLNNYAATNKIIQSKLGERFTQLMSEFLFSKVTPTITPSCDPINDFAFARKPYALMYSDRFDMKPGYAPSTKTQLQASGYSPHCRGQGGWNYSARALALLLGTLESTDLIMPRSLYRDMMNPQHNQNASINRVGWGALSVKGTDYETKFGWKYLPNHNGDRPATAPDGRKVYGKATIIRLPMGYNAVAIVNSSGMEPEEIRAEIRDAFIESVVLQ